LTSCDAGRDRPAAIAGSDTTAAIASNIGVGGVEGLAERRLAGQGTSHRPSIIGIQDLRADAS